jgi:hypothetical protein
LDRSGRPGRHGFKEKVETMQRRLVVLAGILLVMLMGMAPMAVRAAEPASAAPAEVHG